MNAASPTMQANLQPYQSLARMREVHTELIKNHREIGSSSLFIEAAIEFVLRARETGTIIDQDAERCIAQGFLDYWLTIIYRSGQDFPDSKTTLRDFDISLQPELKSSECPYVGLENFSEEQSGYFFGRQKLVKQWISKLAEHRIVAVIGPSGSGKASLISAGVVPALKSGALTGSENWQYFPIIACGNDPLRKLVEAIIGPVGNMSETIAAMRKKSATLLGLVERNSEEPGLLIFRRFEQILALANEEDRKVLVNNLLDLVKASRKHRVILVIRNEFISHLIHLGPLQEQVHKGELFLPPFDASELREVVQKPADRIGLKFDDGLVDALIYDVVGDPAALPLLQFTLVKLWDQRERNRITWKGYHRIGGCRGAFERAAEEMFSQLDPTEQEILKGLLLRIVRPGAAREFICSTVLRARLYDNAYHPQQIDRVIAASLNAGLVRISGSEAAKQRIGVVNQGLVTKWPRLIEWLEDERTKMRQRQRLTIAAAQWREKQEDPSALWAGLLLEEARSYHDLNDLEQEFVDVSVEAKNRSQRSRRLLILAGLFALAVILALVAINFWQRYQLQNENLRLADVERGMRLLDAGDPSGGAVWFANLFKLKPSEPIKTDVCRRRLDIGLRLLPRLLQILPHDREATLAEMSSDERHIVTLTTPEEQSANQSQAPNDIWATGRSNAWLWTIKDKETPHPIQLKSDLPANGVRISPDGTLVATAYGDIGKGSGEVLIWDITGNKPNCIRRLMRPGAVTVVAWSPDGTCLACAEEVGKTSHEQTVLWNWRDQVKPTRFLADGFRIFRITWSPRGDQIATISGDLKTSEVKLWSLKNDPEPLRNDQFRSLKSDRSIAVNDIVFSADGKLLLTSCGIPGGEDGSAQIWNVRTGERLELLPHKGGVITAQFSPDNKLVVTASTDGTARVWSAVSGREMLSLPHNAWVYCATFSPDGRYIATGSRDRMARVWDLLNGQLAFPPMDHGGTVSGVAFSSDGRRLLTTSNETPRVWALSTGFTKAPIFSTSTETLQAAFSGDGRRIVTVTQEDLEKRWKAHFWDATTGKYLATFEPNMRINAAVLSDDGSRCAITTVDDELRKSQVLIVDVDNGKIVSQPIHPAGPISLVVFGHKKAEHLITLNRDTGGETRVAQVWDGETGERLTEPLISECSLSFATLSPDDTVLLTTGGKRDLPKTGIACLWKVARGEQKPITLLHDELIAHGEFSADGKMVVTASEDNCARVWNTADGTALSELLTGLHTADLTYASFSPEGNQILTVSHDGTAVVCEWRSKKIVSVFRHGGVVTGARFSPDGKRVITTSSDRTARLWDVQTNELIAIFSHTWPVENAWFAGDGNTVFTLSFTAAPGRADSLQQVRTSASPSDEMDHSPRAVQVRAWNISVDRKHSEEQLREIAELLAAQSLDHKEERLGILRTAELVDHWQRVRVSYLEDFVEEQSLSFLNRSASASETANQWFAASWHLTQLLKAGNSDPTIRLRRAKAFVQLHEWDAAIADYNVLLQSGQDNDLLLGRAQAYTEMGNWKAAASDCEEIIKNNSNFIPARLTLALALCQQGGIDNAAEQLKKVLELDPYNYMAWQRLAIVEFERDYLDRYAAEQFVKILAINAGTSSTLERLARMELIWDSSAKYRKTCAAMLERLKDKPNLGSIIAWPCVLAPRSVEDFTLVVGLARKASEESASNYYAMNTFGAALYRARLYSEAIEALNCSRKLYAISVEARIAASRDDSLEPQLSNYNQGRAIDWVFLAMSYFQRGHRGDKNSAAWWLEKVRQNVAHEAPVGTEIAADRRDWNRMELEILYKEANNIIADKSEEAGTAVSDTLLRHEQ
jgi:WD40 repeat protein